MASNAEPEEKAKTDGASSNAFENDGSFMEMFKKRMEEQQKLEDEKKQQQGNNTKKPKSRTKAILVAKKTPVVAKKPSTEVEVPYFAQQTMYYKGDGDGGEGGGGGGDASKPQYQGIIGKRKTLMKTVELREKRKKRREELEEQQTVDLKDQKSSAWKTYMAEVKEYEARRCGDTEDHKRPLVK